MLRGTKPRGLWRWLASENSPAYGVEQSLQPIIDATRNYPVAYKYKSLQAVQTLAGPADLSVQLGPMNGKSWLVDAVTFQFSAVRANSRIRLTINELVSALGGQQVVFTSPSANFTATVPTPVGAHGGLPANGTANTSIFPGLGIYLAGLVGGIPSATATASQEHLQLIWSESLLNDTLEMRIRYLEQDIDVAPGG